LDGRNSVYPVRGRIPRPWLGVIGAGLFHVGAVSIKGGRALLPTQDVHHGLVLDRVELTAAQQGQQLLRAFRNWR
jgi:hypothetical protein